MVFAYRVIVFISFLCFKQKTAYEMRISDWSSDVCSSDLDLSLADTLFRPRGRDEREMTLGELRHGVRTGDGPVARSVMQGELHSRLVQAASVAVLPLQIGRASCRERVCPYV